ncbi:hypothetical protein PENTCL1PPCAC_27155, partial [Pristionchus entomophagus]
EECPRCHTENSFVLLDGRYSCRVCNYEDQRRVEYEMDDECNFIDFNKSNRKMMTALQRSVRKSRIRTKGERKKKKETIPADLQIPRIPLRMYGKKYRRRKQPDEKDPPGDVLPRRHPEVETWKRISHRLSSFTQLLARTTRFLVMEKRASEDVKPVAMVIFRRLLASQGIAFSDREWTEVEEDRYIWEKRRYQTRTEIITVEEQRDHIASEIATQNEGLRTGAGVGEDGMWSMLMSDAVTENLQVQAAAPLGAVRMKKKRRQHKEPENIREMTDTSIDALVRGGVLSLNIELLVAISFLACSLVGSRVQMTDLVRWYREARISLPPHFLHDLVKIKYCDDGKMIQLECCTYERHFNFYLHECNSFLQRVMSATRIPRRKLSIRLDEVVASHLSHLNLPFSLMERALVVLARARVDTVDLSIDQADEEGKYCNENSCQFGMEEGRVHPMLSTAYRSPFVTLSTDTRAMAVILLVLRLTFGLRDDRTFQVTNPSRFFNVGTWLRQLRMRLRVYGGEEGETVVRESMRESFVDYDVEWNMELNRTDLVMNRTKLTYRQSPRASFPEGWKPLPKLDGDRFLYKDSLPFPEDGEKIRAKPSRVAMKTPLIYHGERVREEVEKEWRQMEKSREMREAVKLIGTNFKDLDIEEASEPLLSPTFSIWREWRKEEEEVTEEWKHLFPAAVNFEVSSLPRLSVSSLVRLNNMEEGRCMIGGGSGDVALSFVCAAPDLSRPHRFLIQTMSRLIVEAPSVIYAACSMLEKRMLRYQRCLSLVQNLESGGLVIVDDCAAPFSREGGLEGARLHLRRAAGEARNIIDIECIHTIEKRKVKRKEDEETRVTGNEVIQTDDENEIEKLDEEVGDQRSKSGERSGSEDESLVDEEIDEEEVERNDDEEAIGMNSMRDNLDEEGGEGEMSGDELEILEEEPEEKPCLRYKRAQDIYKPMIQKEYYLNFEYLWSILAMRLW